MSRALGAAGLVLAIGTACGVYAIKDQVLRLEGDLRHTRALVMSEQAELGRLRTEYAMLAQPGRLARLASAHLELVPAHPGQIARIEDLPLRRDLALNQRTWRVLLPSGGEATLRLKPAPGLERLREMPPALADAGGGSVMR